MDPISLTLSVVTLFKTCIDGFEYFKAASELKRDFEVLLVKLDFEQERLLVWGDVVGIGKAGVDDFEEDILHSDLTKRCLTSIKNLMEDTVALKSRYGVRPVNPHDQQFERSSVSANALKRFRLRFGRSSREYSVLNRTRWAIHDATKFQSLVSDLRDLIDGLTNQAPVSQNRLDQKVQDDIASMVDDISGLRLVQEACEDFYPLWQQAASVAIDASEVGTLDGRLTQERVGEYVSHTQSDSKLFNRQVDTTAFGVRQFSLHAGTRIFFILTEQCNTRNEESPCDQMRLGQMSFSPKNSYIAPFSVRMQTAPGYRIAEHIQPQDFTSVDLDDYLTNREALQARAADNGDDLPEEAIRHKVKIYVYCSPCACQIATALDVCQYSVKSPFVTFHIRVDYRQATSCCLPSSTVDGICSIIDYLKGIERTNNPNFVHIERMRLLDRTWMEQEEYRAAELEETPEASPESQITRIFSYHHRADDIAAIVILGEADYCVPLMRAQPFPPFEAGSRLRENMMFMLKQDLTCTRWLRSYLASYSSKPPITRNSSLPVTVDKRSSEEITEEKNKRPKTLIAGQ